MEVYFVYTDLTWLLLVPSYFNIKTCRVMSEIELWSSGCS